MEPANHIAERAIRPAVLWRKGSFGRDLELHGRFVECILTVVTTRRLPPRNALDWVTSACQGQHPGLPAPSRLPPGALVEFSPTIS